MKTCVHKHNHFPENVFEYFFQLRNFLSLEHNYLSEVNKIEESVYILENKVLIC